MADKFDSHGAARLLRDVAARLTITLQAPVHTANIEGIVGDLQKDIAKRLQLPPPKRASATIPHPPRGGGLVAMHPAEVLQSIGRTLAFASANLEGVPTMRPAYTGESGDAPIYTVINVFDPAAMQKVAQAAGYPIPNPAAIATLNDPARAELLRRVLPGHPWVVLSNASDVTKGLGMGLAVAFARNMHAAATSQPVIISYTVNTQNSGLVLDAYPELLYTPQRFGSTRSTPVAGNLGIGWWKFETMFNGALVVDSGRHEASANKNATVTGDF